jgi:hypothetical protein
MVDMNGFNANEVPPAQDFEALPPARYEVMIVDSEMIETKAKDGHYMKLTMMVLEGPYKGRNLWTNLNLINKSDKAVQIAKGQLSSICRAVNVLTPKDSTDLHNLPLVVRVDTRKEGDKTYNDVKGFYPRQGGEAAAASDPKSSTTPAKPAGGDTQPAWARKKAQ